jgi:glycosyltransferase 2 family protein
MKFWPIKIHIPHKLRQILYRFGLIAGGSLLLYQFAHGLILLLRTRQSFQIRTPALLIPGIAFALIAVVCQVYGWNALIRLLNVRIPFQKAFTGYVISFLPRYIPGTVWGYLSRGEWLWKEKGVNRAITNFSSILEVAIIILTNLLLYEVAQRPFKGYSLQFGSEILSIIGVAMLVWVIFHFFIQKWGYLPLFNRWLPGLKEWKFSLVDWMAAFISYIAMWLSYGASLWLILRAISPQAVSWSFSSWIQITGYFNLSWLVGFLILFVPAGLGVREAILANLLALNLGINQGIANELTIFFRLVIILSEFILAGLIIGVRITKIGQKTVRIQR